MMVRRLLINGRIWEGEITADWREGVLLLPLSVVAERLGARLQWVAGTDELEIDKDGSKLRLSVGQEEASMQGERVPIGGPIYVTENVVMAPVSLICRCFDLRWAYLKDVDAVVLSRREPALSGKCIMIDAGHGGEDSGAISGDIVESELNWDIAQRLANILNLSGAEVQYTRGERQAMSLSQRVNLVRDAGADLVISIHQNSFAQAEINGTETYWYSSWPARRLAECVQNHVLEELETVNRGVREAAFYLLRHSPVVTVLAKLGFVTGCHDHPMLGSIWMRERAALGIFRGIREYIEG
ncbi:MAG: hypothetical protein GX998_11145 [Firmicutes bacterium]|nr:hypothetical protein [Bacillota bacterium]